MPISAIVTAEVDENIMDEATAIYAAEGLTLSQAFRMLLVRTVVDHAVPFETFNPNEETVEAMMQARRGESVHVGTIENLLADLHADD